MNWISEFVTPKIKALMEKKGEHENGEVLWLKCNGCNRMVYIKELNENNNVCIHCNHHFPLPAERRFSIMFDDGEFSNVEIVQIKDDPLKFRDSKKYVDRLKDARKKTKLEDACSIGSGMIEGRPAVIFVMDFSFMGGSMGLSVGKSFCKAVQLAMNREAAFITFTASGGARMQEGMFSLMQMASTVACLTMLKEKHLPFINVLTHPTTGGVLASFAMLGDINIAEPKAVIGFAGARVIEKTLKQTLPDNFQKSEFLMDHGMIDLVLERKKSKKQSEQSLSC
ncbi:MAG: acetyl-CoA carboxylase, carboxyltransferase subunit beta [Holosporales bacterium]|jgi:acetyl-CoA carboxylase carboxyl transferase subunit beta|nr:acetyl-CoA carboxylase, carboxyltransferase subunit beta [Holosporales bacterium]